MEWSVGLTVIGFLAGIFSAFYIMFKLDMDFWHEEKFKPLVMWFKMLSIISWTSFTILLVLYYLIGE